jgi:hypothetical protein
MANLNALTGDVEPAAIFRFARLASKCDCLDANRVRLA